MESVGFYAGVFLVDAEFAEDGLGLFHDFTCRGLLNSGRNRMRPADFKEPVAADGRPSLVGLTPVVRRADPCSAALDPV